MSTAAHEYSCSALVSITMPTPLSSRVTNHLANERTFLAWLRTAIAMMGFGILIVRLRSSSPSGGAQGRISVAHIGLLFALIGLAMVGFALWNYFATRHAIDNDAYRANATGIVLFASFILLLGTVVVAYLFTTAPLPASSHGF